MYRHLELNGGKNLILTQLTSNVLPKGRLYKMKINDSWSILYLLLKSYKLMY